MSLKTVLRCCSIMALGLLLSAAGPGGCDWGDDSLPPDPPAPAPLNNEIRDAGASQDAGDGCGQRCRIASRDIYQQCIDSNRPEEACRELAGGWTRECIAERCNGGNDADAGPQDDACENRCNVGSRNAYQECIDNNGSVEDCRRRAGEFHEQCMRRCGERDDRTPCGEILCERGQRCVRNQCVDR